MSFDLRPRKRAGALHSPLIAREELQFARKGICFLQHDMDCANGSGATVRADINNALEALATMSSGATEPGTTYAYQFWADTTSGLLKQRNAANGAWEVRGTLAETLNVSRSSNTILAAADHMKFFVATSSFTQTLTAAATLGDGWHCYYRVDSGVTITFDPNSSETIDGAATQAIVGPAAGLIFCDGSNFRTYGFTLNATQAEVDAGTAKKAVTADLNKISLGTLQATTSGTAKNFTGIPAGTRRITVTFNGVSTDGSNPVDVQIGGSGGLETSGYVGGAHRQATSTGATENLSSAFRINTSALTQVFSGQMVLTLMDAATFLWAASWVCGGTSIVWHGGGIKALSAELDRLSIISSSNFDAGSVNVAYQR